MLYDKIKIIAERQNTPIYKIEDDLDFPRGSISRWNKIKPNAYKVKAVADRLGVSTDKLLSD